MRDGGSCYQRAARGLPIANKGNEDSGIIKMSTSLFRDNLTLAVDQTGKV